MRKLNCCIAVTEDANYISRDEFEPCCATMLQMANWRCDQCETVWDCNDSVLVLPWQIKRNHVGIMEPGIGSRPYRRIFYCPWCGKKIEGVQA